MCGRAVRGLGIGLEVRPAGKHVKTCSPQSTCIKKDRKLPLDRQAGIATHVCTIHNFLTAYILGKPGTDSPKVLSNQISLLHCPPRGYHTLETESKEALLHVEVINTY